MQNPGTSIGWVAAHSDVACILKLSGQATHRLFRDTGALSGFSHGASGKIDV
jgi:hypothetical protein